MHRGDLSQLSGSSHRGCRWESPRSCALLDALLNILSHQHAVISSCYYSNCAIREISYNQHDQRVLILADLLKELNQAPNVMVGVLEEAGEDLHHARIKPPLVGGQFAPVLHVGIMA